MLDLWEHPTQHISPTPQKCLLIVEEIVTSWDKASSWPTVTSAALRPQGYRSTQTVGWGGGPCVEGLKACPTQQGQCHLPKLDPGLSGAFPRERLSAPAQSSWAW